MEDDLPAEPAAGDADELVAVPAEARMLVEADAGVGKTHLLCRRIAWLVDEAGLSPGRDILVLSFTRAAVGEIRGRLARFSPRIGAVTPVTFDSLATRILATSDPAGDWPGLNFDPRVERAAARLRESDEEIPVVDRIRHVFVDEAQDLVQTRADFATALLSRLDAGYTVFGDPAQAIYGFSDRSQTPAFLARLEKLHPLPLRHVRLEGNRRARTPAARVALWAGPRLRERRAGREVHDSLIDTVRQLPDAGSIEEAAPVLACVNAPTAILCRDNGEVLWVSEELRRLGVAHRVQGTAEDAPLASWLARLTFGWQRNVISRKELVLRTDELRVGLDPDHVWTTLYRLGPRGREMLDLDRLRARLRAIRPPDELVESAPSQLTVSTVHRAKGLEFDRVLILEPRARRAEDARELDEEAHILYVALTRAISDLMLLRRGAMPIVRKHRGRWTVRERHPARISSFEVGGDAISREEPAGDDGAQATVQQMIVGSVGDPVTLSAIPDARGGPVRYVVRCSDSEIARTSEAFGRYVSDVLGMSHERRPATLEGAYVQLIETSVGHPAVTEQAGIGAGGLWLAPRLGGLLRLSNGNSA